MQPKLRPRGEFKRKRTRRRPDGSTYTYEHQGEDWLFDLKTRMGVPIGGTAVIKRQVDRKTGKMAGHGLYVEIVSADGRERIIVSHLSKAWGKVGSRKKVAAGDPLIWSGDSGNAAGTPPHAHLERYRDGKLVQPGRAHVLHLYHPRS